MSLKGKVVRVLVAGVASIAMTAYAAEPEAVPGEYVVKLKTSMPLSKGAMSALGARFKAPVKSRIDGRNIVVVKRPSFENVDSAKAILSSDPMVELVEPNYIYRISRTPNDPMLGQLWGMENTTTPGVDVGAIAAWDIETGDENLIIASIDTGVNWNHPDLKDNMWVNQAEANGQPGVDDDGNGVIDDIHGYNAITGNGNSLDDQGHGSHTAGTIAARGDDGKGIVGVAWKAKIMSVKFLSAEGSGTLEDAIKAIDYATKMGAKIMSNSWGGGGFSQTLRDSIDRAYQAGALFVAAAGNESNDNDANPSYPASYDVPNVLSVAAIDNKGKLASFSNYGSKTVHVGAPGVGTYSATHTGGYATYSGTSMATPHVSGIAALVMSHEPNLSAVEVKARIVATAPKLANLRGKTSSGGMANAFMALTNTMPQPDPNDPANWQTVPTAISSEHPYANSANQTFSVSVPGAKQIAVYFQRFETEGRYDTLTIRDGEGKVVDTISGAASDSFSAVINGDHATLEFKSDSSIAKYGFDITKLAYR